MSLASKLILGGIFAVVLAICVIGAVLAITAGDDGVEVRLGDDEFRAVDAETGADTIAEDRTPLVFPDPIAAGRPLYVHHLGPRPAVGWIAVEAIAPGTDECLVEWDVDAQEFVDCEQLRYPADGTGLTAYPAEVDDDGRVVVDLGRG